MRLDSNSFTYINSYFRPYFLKVYFLQEPSSRIMNTKSWYLIINQINLYIQNHVLKHLLLQELRACRTTKSKMLTTLV